MMCFDPASLTALFLGTAAAEATATVPAIAATAGLIGTGGTLSLGSVASLAGTALTTIGSVVGGNQAKTASDYNVAVDKQLALDAKRRGSEAMGDKRLQTRQFIAEQRVMEGASGIVPDEGSFGDILAQSAQYGERDAQRIRQNAAREAKAYTDQAGIDAYTGRVAQQLGYIKGGASLLTGSFNLLKPTPWYYGLKEAYS